MLGYRKDGRPIFPIAGGAPDDEDDVGDMGEDGKDGEDGGKPDGEKDDDDADEGDDEDKPDGEDDDEKLGEAGKKALEAEREKNKRLRRELREAKAKSKDKPDEAEAKAEARWKPVFVRREAAHALQEAGLIGKPDRLLKLLDIDKLDVELDEETGEVDVDGLADQVAELRKDYPSLFRKRGSSAIDAADKGGERLGSERTSKLSATEKQARILRGLPV